VIDVEHHDLRGSGGENPAGSAGFSPPERRAFLWRAPGPVRVASTSVLGGGIGERHWFLNVQVDSDYPATDPEGDLRGIAATLGLHGDGVGMLTAKDVRDVASAEDHGVEVTATVGLGWPTWAAAPDEPVVAPTPGTVNIFVVVPVPLSDAALVNAVATATEAKVQALLDAGVRATGTASDAVCVACPVGGAEPERYGGPRSLWGARIARAVHRAVLDGARAS
jgi:adenosylcobinamide amidohydrolase